MSFDKLHTHPVVWDEAKVNQFWTALESTPLTKLSFARALAPLMLDLINAAYPPPASILDFGAGDGTLARTLLDAGYKVAVYDPASGRTNAMRQAGLAGRKGFLGFDGTDNLERYDIVTCFEVMEHILPHQFDSTLNNFSRHVSHGGILIGSVPADEDLEANICLCPDCGALFHHFQHQRSFDEKQLRSTIQKINVGTETVIWIDGRYFFAVTQNQHIIEGLSNRWANIRDKFNQKIRNIPYYKDELLEFHSVKKQLNQEIITLIAKQRNFAKISKFILHSLLFLYNIKIMLFNNGNK